MAAVPVIINGVFMPSGKSANDKPIKGTMLGYASIQGLEVGGGPVIPDPPPDIPDTNPPDHPDSGPNIAVIIKPAPSTGGWGLAQQGVGGPLQWYYVPAQAGPKK